MRNTVTRRTFLRGTGVVGVGGLAGCSGTDGDGGSSDGGSPTEDDADSTPTDTTDDGTVTEDGPADPTAVTVASLNPISGAYSALGPNQRTGVKQAIEWVNDTDGYDFEFDLVLGDTETAAATAQSEAQRVVQQEDASFVVGSISNSVGLGLSEFAEQAEFVYLPGGTAVPITGSACNDWVFRCETNVAQVSEAISGYAVNNLGTDVWFHTAEYAYGDSIYERVKERMQAAHDGFTEVNHTTSELGSLNFGSYISQISAAGPDVLVLGLTGGDLVSFTNQAGNQGLTDEVEVVAPTMADRAVRAGTGRNSVGTYGGVRYLPDLELGDNQQFVEDFRNAEGKPPDNFARVGYDSVRLIARAINEAGSTDPADVRGALEGGTFTTVLGDVTLRETDHQATNPAWMGELVEVDEIADVDLLSKVEGDDTLPPASELDCR